LAKGIRTYYTEKIIRKMFGYAHHNGILKEDKQQNLIKDLVNKNPLKFDLKFQDKFIGIGYLKDFEKNVNFEEGIAIEEKGGKENPLTPALFALYKYNKYLSSTSDEDYLSFHKQWEYLEAHRISNETGSYWEYTHDFKRFDLAGPWVSGLAQGIIASVYLRKFRVEKNREYLDTAKRCIDFCFHKENGLNRSLGEEGQYWIEEYPGEMGSGVLNGYLFFLIALVELTTYDESYEEKLSLGLRTVLSEIPSYHKGRYLKYSKNIPDLANRHYQEIHAYQLDHLFQLTNAKVFEALKNYWLLLSGAGKFY